MSEIASEVTSLTTRPATAIVVRSEADEARESANLIVLRKARKAYEADFKELRKPFEEGLDTLKARFAKVLDPVKAAEQATSAAILAWKQAEARRIQAEKDAAERLHREQVATAQAANRPAPQAPQPVQEQAKGWETERGKVTTRKVPKWRVVDETQIPYEIQFQQQTYKLWELVTGNITRIRNASGDAASPIPGIEFYYDEGLNVR